MKICLLTVGKTSDRWLGEGVQSYSKRLRPPFSFESQLIAGSKLTAPEAIDKESQAILNQLNPGDFVILLDETGQILSSPELAELITSNLQAKRLVLVIGGAYGVNQQLRSRADAVWSLSKLVFPHQLVRLIVAEQLYRAQEISRGSGYHHQ